MSDHSIHWLSASQLSTLYARRELSPSRPSRRCWHARPRCSLISTPSSWSTKPERAPRPRLRKRVGRRARRCRRSTACRPRSRTRRRQRLADALRFARHRRDRGGGERRRRRQDAGRGHGPARQVHDAGVRLEGADQFAAARHHAQPVEPRPLARRLVGRCLLAHRRRRQSLQPWQRRRRLDPHSRGAHRPGWPEAILRPHRAVSRQLAVRRRDQPGRAGAQRALLGAGPERVGRPRPARLAFAAGRAARLHDRAGRRRARPQARPQPRFRPRQGRSRGARAGRRRRQALRGARRASSRMSAR